MLFIRNKNKYPVHNIFDNNIIIHFYYTSIKYLSIKWNKGGTLRKGTNIIYIFYMQRIVSFFYFVLLSYSFFKIVLNIVYTNRKEKQILYCITIYCTVFGNLV